MVKIVFCDIDGCMGNFVKPDYPLKQNLDKNLKNLELIREKTRKFNGILFGVATARSFYQADHVMDHANHKGPSIFEMGNVIFEPDRGVYFLFEEHPRFKEHIPAIREFIGWIENMIDREQLIKEKFPDSAVRQMKDRNCMLTYEFEKDIGKELYSYLREIMPVNIREAIEKGILKVLFSKNAIDILPNLNKGDAVSHLVKKYNLSREDVLAIGDSSHSDLDLLEAAGLVACPYNADPELKKYVLSRKGFIAPNSASEGLLNIFDIAELHIKWNSIRQ